MTHSGRFRGDPSAALVARLARYDSLVEVGVGARPDVAAGLVAAGSTVTATDVRHRSTPDGVDFVRDDVTRPDRDVYAGVDVVYARNLPRELHRPVRTVAREVGADCLFTTLGGEFPAVPTDSETLPDETLFRAATRGPTRSERGERA